MNLIDTQKVYRYKQGLIGVAPGLTYTPEAVV